MHAGERPRPSLSPRVLVNARKRYCVDVRASAKRTLITRREKIAGHVRDTFGA